jgi:hypothetical protein
VEEYVSEMVWDLKGGERFLKVFGQPVTKVKIPCFGYFFIGINRVV